MPRELRTAQELHRAHYGMPVLGRETLGSGSMPSLTYITEQPKRITQEEYPLVIPQTSTVSVPESTYMVATPTDEPPGQKALKRSHDSDIVPKHLIYKQYSKKTKRKQQKQYQEGIRDVAIPETQAIDLPQREDRQKFPCDFCGAILSSKYNLKRHKQREWLRLHKIGKETPVEEQPEYLEWLRSQEEEQQPIQEQQQQQEPVSQRHQQQEPQPRQSTSRETPQFESWIKFPAKRTSSEAKFKPQSYRKRAVVLRDPESQLTFSQWENPKSKPKGESKINLSKGKRATSPPPEEEED